MPYGSTDEIQGLRQDIEVLQEFIKTLVVYAPAHVQKLTVLALDKANLKPEGIEDAIKPR